MLTNRLRTLFRLNNIVQITANSSNQAENTDLQVFKQLPKSMFENNEEDLTHVAPYLKPTFNFAAYVNNSITLQELLKLGVNLHKIEKKPDQVPYILGLDFEKDIKNHVIFLHDRRVSLDNLGMLITKNPYIFKESLDDMEVRLNYLESKGLNEEMIARILSHNPFWLMFSTQDIDSRLGIFQNEFNLKGAEVRSLMVKQPKLITYSIKHVKKNMFVIKEEMGFTDEEMKQMLMMKPNLFMNDSDKLLKTFEYLHQHIKISLETIAKMPEVLTCRLSRLRQRHMYLQKIGKANYNPKEPGYISLISLVSGDDAHFSVEVAKTTIESFNTFLKSF